MPLNIYMKKTVILYLHIIFTITWLWEVATYLKSFVRSRLKGALGTLCDAQGILVDGGLGNYTLKYVTS